MALHRGDRRAVTLIELLVVVMIIGVMTAVVVGRLGAPSIGNPGAQATARRLALDLRLARISAISSGSNHYVGFDVSGTNLTGYTIYRVALPSDVVTESYRRLDRGVTIASGAVRAEFDPAGQALGGFVYTVAGSTQDFTVHVIAATGAVTVSEP
jgi:prepilin-type N-terminal cleavage/methylation domain-containing protein